MPQSVKPFCATHYNRRLAADLLKVVCPPYDVIDKEKLSFLKRRSPYNYCRVSLADGNNYDKPVLNLKKWLDKKILVDDNQENYYLYQQKFAAGEKTFSRFGVLCLLNMAKKEIFPHEHTLNKPKEDRKKMIAKLKANLSPIFVIAGDSGDFLTKISRRCLREKPFLEFSDGQNNLNRVWKVSNAPDKGLITSSLQDSHLVIADGHHRFEISYDYFKKNRGKFKDLSYILAYVTTDQPGLVILPTHRILTPAGPGSEIFSSLSNRFALKPASRKELGRKLRLSRKFCFGVYRRKKFYFASLKNPAILDTISPAAYKKLDSYIFHKIVLPELRYTKIQYTHSIDGVQKLTQKDETAFLLKPASLDAVFNIARSGHKLPQKSTYFYPKVFSGLVLRRFR